MSTNPYGFPITVPGSKAPVRMWSPLYDVDHTAQQQIRNASLLPWVHGVAVMPDVHAGAGVTVGSVIAVLNKFAGDNISETSRNINSYLAKVTERLEFNS